MAANGRPSVHLCFLDAIGRKDRDSITTRLKAAGVEAASERRGPVDGIPELVVTASLDEEAVHEVRQATVRGATRVLLVLRGGSSASGDCWRLLRSGADDIVPWDDPTYSAERVAARLRRWADVDAILGSPSVRNKLVGRSRAWVTALRELAEAARATDATILLTGESGTGKELAAAMIHELDSRPDRQDLVVVDCTTIVPSLSGSEFFGHERGAFTDAVTAREGAFSQADRGTLFLDELGELPLGLQGELLRVIQEKMYKRLGSGTWRQSRFRLVCATNRDLKEEVANGRFRNDLFHRVAALTVRLPCLRERREDIPELARHFLHRTHPDREGIEFDDAVLDVLHGREYPGNVRELRQLVERIAGRHDGPGPITAGELPPEERPLDQADADSWPEEELESCIRSALARRVPLERIARAAREMAIRIALREADGSLQRASQRLGITRRALELRRRAARATGNCHE